MLRGALAGAGLVALLDLLLRLPVLAPGFWREAALLASLGALLAGLLVAASLAGAARWRGRPAPSVAAAFGWSVAVAAVPVVGALLPKPIFGLVLPFALAPLLVWFGRRPFRPILAATGLAAAALLLPLAILLVPGDAPPQLPPPAGPAGQGPDVLLISCDTLRADALAELDADLPHLRELRERGAWAPYALAPSSSTRPSHTTMLSGLPVFSHAVQDNQWRMGEGIPLVSERFRAAGWRTAAVVSNAMISAQAGFDRGFEVFDETPVVRRHFRNEELAGSEFSLAGFLRVARRGTWLGWLGLYRPWLEELLLDRWKGLAGNQGNGSFTLARARALLGQLQAGAAPYFLFVHLMDPHTPYLPPDDCARRPGRPLDVPPAFRGTTGAAPGDWDVVNRVGVAVAAGDPEAAAYLASLRELYLEEVVYVDGVVGELLAEVVRGGRDTVVLFTSDHGEQFGEHGLVLHSNSLYEPLLRVPFLLAGPGIPPGPLAATPHLEDVAPTLLAAAGLATDGLPGRDLLAAGAGARPHVERFHELLAVRDGVWKLLLERDAAGEFQPRALFRLDEDPGEERDLLAEDPPEARSLLRLAAAAIQAERSAAAGARRDQDASHQDAMRELGYVY